MAREKVELKIGKRKELVGRPKTGQEKMCPKMDRTETRQPARIFFAEAALLRHCRPERMQRAKKNPAQWPGFSPWIRLEMRYQAAYPSRRLTFSSITSWGT